MKFSVLASGSKGNATYVNVGGHRILIDVGITFKDLDARLNGIGVSIESIDTLLLTHSHSDHTKGLMTFYKKVNPTIYMSDKTYSELDILDIDYIGIKNEFNIDDINIKTIILSHDVACYGYIITYNNNSLVYITDTGYINERYIEKLKNKNIYIFESNHDIEMNLKSRKPLKYRMRVVSDIGHLSNSQAAYYLSKLVGENTTHIFLAHLSEEDNDPIIALNTVKESINNKNISVNLTYQKKSIDLVEV